MTAYFDYLSDEAKEWEVPSEIEGKTLGEVWSDEYRTFVNAYDGEYWREVYSDMRKNGGTIKDYGVKNYFHYKVIGYQFKKGGWLTIKVTKPGCDPFAREYMPDDEGASLLSEYYQELGEEADEY